MTKRVLENHRTLSTLAKTAAMHQEGGGVARAGVRSGGGEQDQFRRLDYCGGSIRGGSGVWKGQVGLGGLGPGRGGSPSWKRQAGWERGQEQMRPYRVGGPVR